MSAGFSMDSHDHVIRLSRDYRSTLASFSRMWNIVRIWAVVVAVAHCHHDCRRPMVVVASYLSLSQSHSLSISLSLSLSPSSFVSLFLSSFSFSLYVYLYLSLYLFRSPSLSLSLSICVSLSLPSPRRTRCDELLFPSTLHPSPFACPLQCFDSVILFEAAHIIATQPRSERRAGELHMHAYKRHSDS